MSNLNVIAKMADKNAMFLSDNSPKDEERRAFQIERDIKGIADDLDRSLTCILADVKALQEFLKCERGCTSSNLSRYAADADQAMAKLTTLMPLRKYHSNLLPE